MPTPKRRSKTRIHRSRVFAQDLDDSAIDWSQFSLNLPDALTKKPLKVPFPHQETAIQKVVDGFGTADHGKLIMACGTGKTFTSLKIAERMVPAGSTVLFLVPSISLLSQTLKEWTIESPVPPRSFAVCSDVSVGKRKTDEDIPVTDLAYPATTNAARSQSTAHGSSSCPSVKSQGDVCLLRT